MSVKFLARFAVMALITSLALNAQACDAPNLDPVGDPTSTITTAAVAPIVTEQTKVRNTLMAELLSQAFTEDAVPVREMAQSGDPVYIPVLTELLRFQWLLYYNVWQDTLTTLDTLARNPEDVFTNQMNLGDVDKEIRGFGKPEDVVDWFHEDRSDDWRQRD